MRAYPPVRTMKIPISVPTELLNTSNMAFWACPAPAHAAMHLNASKSRSYVMPSCPMTREWQLRRAFAYRCMSLHAHMSDNARNSQKDEGVNFPGEGPESCAPELSFQINGTCKTHPHAWRAIECRYGYLSHPRSQPRKTAHAKLIVASSIFT